MSNQVSKKHKNCQDVPWGGEKAKYKTPSHLDSTQQFLELFMCIIRIARLQNMPLPTPRSDLPLLVVIPLCGPLHGE